MLLSLCWRFLADAVSLAKISVEGTNSSLFEKLKNPHICFFLNYLFKGQICCTVVDKLSSPSHRRSDNCRQRRPAVWGAVHRPPHTRATGKLQIERFPFLEGKLKHVLSCDSQTTAASSQSHGERLFGRRHLAVRSSGCGWSIGHVDGSGGCGWSIGHVDGSDGCGWSIGHVDGSDGCGWSIGHVDGSGGCGWSIGHVDGSGGCGWSIGHVDGSGGCRMHTVEMWASASTFTRMIAAMGVIGVPVCVSLTQRP